MNGKYHPGHHRVAGAALVLSLFLVTILVTTGSALTLLAATETMRADHVALDLDHELAVSSLVACLPKLMQARQERHPSSMERQQEDLLFLEFGQCKVRCRVTDNARKSLINSRSSPDELGSRLQGLARENELPANNIQVRPVAETAETKGWPKVLWFDQLTIPTGIEEVFHRCPIGADETLPKHHSWSDVVTFWEAGSGGVIGLDIETIVGESVQRHYVVVALSDGSVDVLYRGRP